MKPYSRHQKQEVTHLGETPPIPEQDRPRGGHLYLRIHKDQQKALARRSNNCTCLRAPGNFALGRLPICNFLLAGGCTHIFKVVDMIETWILQVKLSN